MIIATRMNVVAVIYFTTIISVVLVIIIIKSVTNIGLNKDQTEEQLEGSMSLTVQ